MLYSAVNRELFMGIVGGPLVRHLIDFFRLCHRKRLMLYFLEIPKK